MGRRKLKKKERRARLFRRGDKWYITDGELPPTDVKPPVEPTSAREKAAVVLSNFQASIADAMSKADTRIIWGRIGFFLVPALLAVVLVVAQGANSHGGLDLPQAHVFLPTNGYACLVILAAMIGGSLLLIRFLLRKGAIRALLVLILPLAGLCVWMLSGISHRLKPFLGFDEEITLVIALLLSAACVFLVAWPETRKRFGGAKP